MAWRYGFLAQVGIVCGLVAAGLAAAADADAAAPAPPAWLSEVTRVAYTDLPNTRVLQDWPEAVIADLAAAGVQVLFSRCHSGDEWQGLGWKSRFGDLDPALRGRPIDWELPDGAALVGEARSGQRCLRILHAGGRAQSYLNRRWSPRDGRQGAMLDRLSGTLSFAYKVLSASQATVWLGAIPMSAEPWENTGAPRTGVSVPAAHVGDGEWHVVTIPYDYTANPKARWVHTSCVISGTAAEVLLDDVSLLGVEPQPLRNGGFEEVAPDRDGTRQVTELCHRAGMRYIAYYWAQREPRSVGEAHPEWRCRNQAGTPTDYYCSNTPYRDLVRDRIVELVSEVGVDGVFFDMFHTRADECYCDACREAFRTQSGQEPPVKEDFDSLLWQQWVDFKFRSIERCLLDYNRALKAANPEAALLVNTWNAWAYRTGGNTRNSIRVAESADGLLEETGWYDVADPSFFAFPARHNFMNWHLAGLCRGKRAFMWGAPTVPGWQAVSAVEARTRVMTMLTNGAVPTHSVPGRDVMRQYMAEVAERAPYLTHAEAVPWCGLVVSEKTEFWYGRDNPKERYLKGVYGAFQALLERHLPVALVTDRDLEVRGVPEGIKVLLLPNCAAMSEAEMASVRRFVLAGGGLVATYETSLYDEHGQAREAFGLADLLQARKTGDLDARRMQPAWGGGVQTAASWRFAEEHRWSADAVIQATLAAGSVTQPPGTLNRDVPLHCRLLQVEATGAGASALRLLTAAPGPAPGQVIHAEGPGVIESVAGKGRVIYLPADVTWSSFRYGHEYLGRLLELALRAAADAPPPLAVQAPSVVQASAYRQGERLVVHLLNDISSFGRSQNVVGESLYVRREVLPIHDIEVTFRDPALRRFTWIPGGAALVARPGEQGTVVSVPRLELHGLLVAEP
jgi:hypothetical protein